MFAVQMGLWRISDEELAAVGIGAGVRHGERTGLVFPAVPFVRKAVSRIATPGPRGIATLDHETGDNAVESRVIIITVFDQKDKIIHGFGRIGGEEFEGQDRRGRFSRSRYIAF